MKDIEIIPQNKKDNDKIIEEKRNQNVNNMDFNIAWEGQPAGLLGSIATFFHMNFTWYKISKDELIITRGFINRKTDTIELYLLKDPDLTESLWQRIYNVGTISVKIDSHINNSRAGRKISMLNIKNASSVRKLLRDYIEADVMERNITYVDRV